MQEAPIPAAPADAAARVQRLREDIARYDHAYYLLDAPLIPDADYDALFRELQQLEEQWPALRSAARIAPFAAWGASASRPRITPPSRSATTFATAAGPYV